MSESVKKEDLLEAARRLSKLSQAEYELVRKEEAKKLGVTLKFLDKAILVRQKTTSGRRTESPGCANTGNTPLSGESELENGIEPWSEAIDGLELVSEISDILTEHVIMPKECIPAVVAWTFCSYCIDAFGIFPRLLITSPEKRCGKTTLLRAMHSIVHRVLPASNLSPSSIFRSIAEWQPTFLIDEADTFLNSENEDMRNVINSGYEKTMSGVIRIEEEAGKRVPKVFSTWTPMVLAMIGMPPDTIVDRSIHIQLRRKLKEEGVKRWDWNNYMAFTDLRRKIKRWIDDHIEKIKESPFTTFDKSCFTMLDGLGDRVSDNWLPLLAIASLIKSESENEDGSESSYITKVIAAIEYIDRHKKETETGGTRIELLEDIIEILNEQLAGSFVYSSELINALVSMDDRRWGEYSRGKPITPHIMARLLKPFKIFPKKLDSASNKRGYFRTEFEEAAKIYL